MSDAGQSFSAGFERQLGNVRRVSNLNRRAEGLAGQEAARNLLAKAYRELDGGNPQRARHYLHLAAGLAWDRHENAHPAAMEAHTAVFNQVAGDLEASEQGDHDWLTAAAAAIEALPEQPAAALTQVLAAIDQDYRLPRVESRTIRALTGGRGPDPDAFTLSLTAAASTEQVQSGLEATLAALLAYHRARGHR